MAHDHDHHHAPVLKDISNAFIIGMILNTAFVIIEFVAGIWSNSLALISDAGHNLSDVATLGLSLFAFQLTKKRATQKYTFGYQRSTIMASLINAVILLLAIGSIGWEAINRFLHPVASAGGTIAIVAGIGILINTASALLFFKQKESDINIKGAYLHLMLDAMVSAGVVLAGIAIKFTHWLWIDPMISLVIMFIVLYSTWGILKESIQLSLDAVPKNVEVDSVKAAILEEAGVKNIHHIHIWAMSTTMNAMTAHLLIEEQTNEEQLRNLKAELKHKLNHLNIHHITFETEKFACPDEHCDPPTEKA